MRFLAVVLVVALLAVIYFASSPSVAVQAKNAASAIRRAEINFRMVHFRYTTCIDSLDLSENVRQFLKSPQVKSAKITESVGAFTAVITTNKCSVTIGESDFDSLPHVKWFED